MNCKKDVYLNAEELNRNYVMLLRKIKKGRKAGKKRRTNNSSLYWVQRSISQLDAGLFNELTPEVFREIVILEFPWESENEKSVICFRMLSLAKDDSAKAKKLASLLLHITSFYTGEGYDAEEPTDICYTLVQHALMAKFIERVHERQGVPIDETIQKMSGFMNSLYRSADQGDQDAFGYVRLLYSAMLAWGNVFVPILEREYTHEDYRDYLEAMQISTSVGTHGAPVEFPIACSQRDFRVLDEARRQEFRGIQDNLVQLDAGKEMIEAIPLQAYKNFLTAMWEYISSQTALRFVMSGCRDKVVIEMINFNMIGFQSLAFSREDVQGNIIKYPAVDIYLFSQRLCEKHVAIMRLQADGSFAGMDRSAMGAHYLNFIRCIIMDAYATIVVPADAAESCPKKIRKKLARTRRGNDERVGVHAYFRQGNARPDQVKRALQETGLAPAPGFTYVSEHWRCFPGEKISDEVAPGMWEHHVKIKPTLSFTYKDLEILLSEIDNFG